MIRSFFKRFVLLVITVGCVLCLPEKATGRLRVFVISGLSPSWSFLEKFGAKNEQGNAPSKGLGSVEVAKSARLEAQIERLEEWLLSEKHVEKKLAQLAEYRDEEASPYFIRRYHHLYDCIQRHLHALPAQVVFREPGLWSSILWLGVGERDNEALDQQVVAKGSPVVQGLTVVGVVEEVTDKRCRVRLITDQMLKPSVRVVRGPQSDRLLDERIQGVIELLALRDDIFGAKELAHVLDTFREELLQEEPSLHLAKGEIHGASAPLWKSGEQVLQGIGFQYDFADEEGPALSLRSGLVTAEGVQEPLMRVGDLLVTTGMDGIFPPDLHVGIVTKIFPLREGASSYKLEARPIISNFHNLRELVVLPPI